MKLADELEAEHVLIEQVAGAFLTYVERRVAGKAESADAARFSTFFRRWVGGYHHDREEEVLFKALVRELEVPADRGPLHALTLQHHALAAVLSSVEPLLGGPAEAARVEAMALARQYVHGLWQHIDAENSVLLPESAARLSRVGQAGLSGRPPDAGELEAREDGARLVAAYPPVFDPSAHRGDGCPACPSYGVTCQGLERTWWNEHEWAESGDHLG